MFEIEVPEARQALPARGRSRDPGGQCSVWQRTRPFGGGRSRKWEASRQAGQADHHPGARRSPCLSRFYILCSSYKNAEQCPILCGEGQVGVEGGGGGVGRVRSQPGPEGRRPSLGCVGEVEGVGPLCLWLRRHGEEMQPRVQHEKHGVVTVRFPRGDTLQSGGSWGAT